MIVADLVRHLDERFPFEQAPDWDPVGVQIGWPSHDAGRVAVCHEVTEAIADQAETDGVDTIVSYHPLLFDATVRFVAGPTAHGRALRLARNGVSLIVVHTALDAAEPGTADAALARLGLGTRGAFGRGDANAPALGRFGDLPAETDAASLGARVEEAFGGPTRVADGGGPIRRVGVLPGSGGSFLTEAVGTVDAVITGDVSHHRASAARAAGLTVIDTGHSATERAGVDELYAAVSAVAPDAVRWKDDPTPWERTWNS